MTYSKSRRYYVEAQPSHCTGADGQHLILPDGKTCLDTVSGLGANLISAVNSFSLPSTLEVEYCERLRDRIGLPGWKVKLVKTGSEADQAAVRFARGYTKRQGVLSLGYNGWHNEFISPLPGAMGCITTDVVKVSSLEELITKLESGPMYAAVILEAVQLEINVKWALKRIKSLCEQRGIILIYDEVITGMRMPLYTVAATLGLWPDIMTCGKAMGGGYPLGVVMGVSDIMDTRGVFVSGTFSGETSALKAGMAVLDYMTPSLMSSWYGRCNDFMRALQWAVREHIRLEGYGTRIVMKDKVEGSMSVPRYMQEMYSRHRILIGPVLFPRAGWDREYSQIIDASTDVMKNFNEVKLTGEPPRPVFKR